MSTSQERDQATKKKKPPNNEPDFPCHTERKEHSRRVRSLHFFPVWHLSGEEECFHQFALAAGDHAGEASSNGFKKRTPERVKSAVLRVTTAS